jgi:hypothetical protein
VGEGGLRAEPVGVVAGSDEQLGGDVVADPVHPEQRGCGPLDERTDHDVELVQLVIE